MYKAQYMKAPSRPRYNEFRIGADEKTRFDGGLCLKYGPTQINDNQLTIAKNVIINDDLEIVKRFGQSQVYTNSLGLGGVLASFPYLYSGKKVFAWSTKLYTQINAVDPVQIKSGLSAVAGTFFAFNSVLYYINRTDYVQWDGTTATDVVGYIPTTIIVSTPAGAGTVFESINFIQPGFKNQFSADGTSTTYHLDRTVLDATTVTITVDGVAKTEGTHFTVNRTLGTINFAAGSAPFGAPPATTPGNVTVTAYKTYSGYANQIKNCKYAVAYGGENDTRIFLAGNVNYPNRMYRSGTGDATYFPDDQFQDVGSNFEAITGLAVQYGMLVELKERSIYFSTYLDVAQQGFWGADGYKVSFPTFPLNTTIGCDMPGSIQLINNRIVFSNTETGPHIITKTDVRDEMNVQPIGGNIIGGSGRTGLLDLVKVDLQACSSADFDGKYYLGVGNEMYVWCYRAQPYVDTGNPNKDDERLAWFYYTNVNAACFVIDSRGLYFGDRTNGTWTQTIADKNDFGVAIPGQARTKSFSFGRPDWYKNVTDIWINTEAAAYAILLFQYLTENDSIMDDAEVETASFSWDHFSWDNFTWDVIQFPPTQHRKPKLNKVIYFGLDVSNDEINQNLSLISLAIQYMFTQKVK